MKTLKISKDISLPTDIVTQTIAILAKRRAGKSYTMRKICEELLESGQQIVMVDPKGDQWGIRSSADGKKPGYPIVILGGEHGDVPLEVNAGEMVAKLVVEERVSILLDLSIFRKHELATFMTAFLENLYRLKAKEEYRTPVMLVIDEADAIAPQKPQQNEARMLGAAEDIVRRGGQRGIGCALITQRSAVLNKNVLTQAQVLIVLRTIAPQDLSAMKAWVDVHGTVEEGKILMESLPSLPIGDAWFWSPGYPTEAGIFKRTHILPITTFDSGATPKPGEKKIVPKNLADINLDALKKQMADTIEKAKSDDPKLLKKRIAELEKEKLAGFQQKNVEIDPKVLKIQIQKALDKQGAHYVKEINSLQKVFQKIHDLIKPHISDGMVLYNPSHEASVTPAILPEKVPDILASGMKVHYVPMDGDDSKPLSKGAKAIVSYLHSVYPQGKTKTQLWIATGYSPGGGFNNMIYELTAREMIVKGSDGLWKVHQVNRDEIDENFYVSLDLWKAKLGLGARKVFELMLQHPYDLFTKETLAQNTGYALGGGFNNNIYELTGPELIKKVGTTYGINPEVLTLT